MAAIFRSGNRVGQQLQFCWEVTPEDRPYSYTIRQLSPVQQVVRPLTQHSGGDDCMIGDIQPGDVGTLIVRIEITMDGKTAGAQVSRTVLP
ncbi:MAG: hypothetical protein C0506_09710 [Anaerolinea sp.]|nr:hypothetical protein [Anaerolinea sp.]